MKDDKIFLSVLAGLISSMSQKYSVILILVLRVGTGVVLNNAIYTPRLYKVLF